MLAAETSRALRHGELTLSGVSLSRGRQPLFAGISLTVLPGDVVWIGGDNGIGKTSLLRVMTGLSRADSGDVSWSLGSTPCPAHNAIAYQGHQDAFKSVLTAREALEFWADVMDRPADINALLSTVGLAARADVPCGQLSAGQKRRLSLARLILSQNPIWIMDEPTAAMDAAGVGLIHRLIAAHVRAGGSAVIASHRAPLISGVRTRQLVLKAAAS